MRLPRLAVIAVQCLPSIIPSTCGAHRRFRDSGRSASLEASSRSTRSRPSAYCDQGFDSRLRISHIQIISYVWIKDMCNNIMVCKFLIQDLKVSLCIANLVHMTAVMVSPALKAQKQELSLQDRVTYNMKVLIAIRQTSQKDLAQAMGIAAPTLSQKFSGRTRWNMDDIEKASDFLDVKPEALVAGHGFEPWTSGDTRGPRFKSMGLPSLSKLSLAA